MVCQYEIQLFSLEYDTIYAIVQNFVMTFIQEVGIIPLLSFIFFLEGVS